MLHTLFATALMILDSQMIPGKRKPCGVKRWKLTITELRLTLPEMANLAVKPREAGGVEVGGRKRRKWARGHTGGGLQDSNQFLHWGQVDVSRVIIGQLGKARDERDFRKSPALPPACFPPSQEVDCKERQEGRMYQTQRRKNPCHSPPWHLLHCSHIAAAAGGRLTAARAGGESNSERAVFFSPESLL